MLSTDFLTKEEKFDTNKVRFMFKNKISQKETRMHPSTTQEDRSATIGVVRMYGRGYVRLPIPTQDVQKPRTNTTKTGDKNKSIKA